jgi:hypothetical protein
MATKKKETTARWLEKDGRIELQADSEAAKAQGWAEPRGTRPNGEPYNPEPVDGITPQAEFVAQLHASNAEVEAERAAKREAEREAAFVEPEHPVEADLKVEIVQPKSDAKTSTKAGTTRTVAKSAKR